MKCLAPRADIRTAAGKAALATVAVSIESRRRVRTFGARAADHCWGLSGAALCEARHDVHGSYRPTTHSVSDADGRTGRGLLHCIFCKR